MDIKRQLTGVLGDQALSRAAVQRIGSPEMWLKLPAATAVTESLVNAVKTGSDDDKSDGS